MGDTGVIKEDKTVGQLEALSREIDNLRSELSDAKERIAFLESRVAIAHDSAFGDRPEMPHRR